MWPSGVGDFRVRFVTFATPLWSTFVRGDADLGRLFGFVSSAASVHDEVDLGLLPFLFVSGASDFGARFTTLATPL
jgi:hypothetical protein